MGSNNELFIGRRHANQRTDRPGRICGILIKNKIMGMKANDQLVITEPYELIAEAFRFADIGDYREMIQGVMMGACSETIYRRKTPGDLLYEFKIMLSIVDAAELINKKKKKNLVIKEKGDLFDKRFYRRRHDQDNEWTYFPRFLSKREYVNPYLVFKKFFTYKTSKKWKEDLDFVLNYSLSRYSMIEDNAEMDVLTMFIYLSKLVEAAHLVDVRSNLMN
jgi:hypothetical protein